MIKGSVDGVAATDALARYAADMREKIDVNRDPRGESMNMTRAEWIRLPTPQEISDMELSEVVGLTYQRGVDPKIGTPP